MVMRFLIVVGMVVLMRFCGSGVMGMIVYRALSAVAVIVAVFEAMRMAVVVLVGMVMLLIAMLVRMLMLVLVFVGMGVLMGMFTVAHLCSPFFVVD